VDAAGVLGSVGQLDEVVLENGTGVAPAAIDLLDLEVTGLDDGGLRHRCQAGQGRQPQGEGRCGDAEAGGALPDGGTDRACAHGGARLEVRDAGVGGWGEGGGRGRDGGSGGAGGGGGRPGEGGAAGGGRGGGGGGGGRGAGGRGRGGRGREAGEAGGAGVGRPAGRAWEAGVRRPGRWPRGKNALSRAGSTHSDAALLQSPLFPPAPSRDGCTGSGRGWVAGTGPSRSGAAP